MTTPLRNYTSEQGAYHIRDYPYGKKCVHTDSYVWIETSSQGDRYCQSTVSPHTGKRPPKPFKSKYYVFAYLFIADDGSVQYDGLAMSNARKLPEYHKLIVEVIGEDNITPTQKNNIRKLLKSNIRAEYAWEQQNYDGAERQKYQEWAALTVQHIEFAPFAEICNYKPFKITK